MRPLRRTATDTWQQLVAGTRADIAGFVHISLLNESPAPAYFDDLTARTVAPVPYQENHYDPFGLNLVGIETTGDPNAQYQYNGKEKQEDFNLNWTDYGARMYDAALGRFNTVDRFADKYAPLTPYHYGSNNPMSYTDINGDSLNLQLVVNFDAANGTHVVDMLLKGFSEATGMNFHLDGKSNLAYARNGHGQAIVRTTTDSQGNSVEEGSNTARRDLLLAVDDRDKGYFRVVNTGHSVSAAGGKLIDLDKNQIEGFIAGAHNVDSRTLGWSMTALHELNHSKFGLAQRDFTGSTPAYGYTGPVVDHMNQIRRELNAQGGDFGQRTSYPSFLDSSTSPASLYLPFDNGALNSIKQGQAPSPSSKYIKY